MVIESRDRAEEDKPQSVRRGLEFQRPPKNRNRRGGAGHAGGGL